MAKTKDTVGFGLTCPHCRDEDQEISLNLEDLDELRCSGCDATFSAVEARDMVAAELTRWDGVVHLVELARRIAAGELAP